MSNLYAATISDGVTTAGAMPWIDYYGEQAESGYHYNKVQIALNSGTSVGAKSETDPAVTTAQFKKADGTTFTMKDYKVTGIKYVPVRVASEDPAAFKALYQAVSPSAVPAATQEPSAVPAATQEPSTAPSAAPAAAEKVTVIKVKALSKTFKVSKVKKKAQSFSLGASADSKGKLSFSKVSGSKQLVLDKKNGKITVKKKTKKGKYSIQGTFGMGDFYE